MKPAIIVSFLSAAAAFLIAPTGSWMVAGQRALLVFTGVFIWTALAMILLGKIIPKGLLRQTLGRPNATGRGDAKYVDLEKQSVDMSRLQDLLR